MDAKGWYFRIPSREILKRSLQVAWQVLKATFLLPILRKVLPTDLSPPKPILVEGVWDRVGSRLVPLKVGGASRDF
jgi:hypothetical protein